MCYLVFNEYPEVSGGTGADSDAESDERWCKVTFALRGTASACLPFLNPEVCPRRAILTMCANGGL